MELKGEFWKKVPQATVKSTRLKNVAEELASVNLKMAASRVGSANPCWSTYSAAKGAIKVEDNVSKVPAAVSVEVTDATKRKVSITRMELKNALM